MLSFAPGHSAAPLSYITNLYNALLKAGAVSTSGTLVGIGEIVEVEEIKPETVDCHHAVIFTSTHYMWSFGVLEAGIS